MVTPREPSTLKPESDPDEAAPSHTSALPSENLARLEELLSQWQREAEQGRDLTAIDLCRDFPDLIAKLDRRIQALRQLDRFH